MKKRTLLIIALFSVATAAMAHRDEDTDKAGKYFLRHDQVANSTALIQQVPDTASARFAYDREQYEWGKTLRDTERGRQAVVDADLSDGWIDRCFSESFGIPVTKNNLPETYSLLMKVMNDAGDLAVCDAKKHYQRVRPFVYWREHTSTPDHEEALKKNGSYPSGHTSIGWATALILAELNPARINEILQRGYEYGQSRVIVGAHYQSDVDQGRVAGAGVVAALHSDPSFREALERARNEVAFKLKQTM